MKKRFFLKDKVVKINLAVDVARFILIISIYLSFHYSIELIVIDCLESI